MCNISQNQMFKTVLLSNSNKFILVQPPTEDSTPSENDIAITQKLLKSCEILNIQFLDHLVIGDNEYQSIMKYL